MTDENKEIEQTYWARDVANILDIGTSTLRKWCLVLEKNGYRFLRDEHDRRAFVDHDVMALKHLKELTKEKSMSLENASIAVISRFNRDKNEGRTLSATSKDMRSLNRYKELESKIEYLVEYAEKQEAFNAALQKRLERHEEWQKKRDEQLMETLRKLQETKKLMVASEERPWWKRIFRKR